MKKDELLKNRVQSLPPIIDESSEILILGTMPGKESLRSKEYYAAPNNSFWKIMKRLFNSNKLRGKSFVFKETPHCIMGYVTVL